MKEWVNWIKRTTGNIFHEYWGSLPEGAWRVRILTHAGIQSAVYPYLEIRLSGQSITSWQRKF